MFLSEFYVQEIWTNCPDEAVLYAYSFIPKQKPSMRQNKFFLKHYLCKARATHFSIKNMGRFSEESNDNVRYWSKNNGRGNFLLEAGSIMRKIAVVGWKMSFHERYGCCLIQHSSSCFSVLGRILF